MSDTFEIHLERIAGYQFRADFGSADIAALIVDEPPPLGAGSGPNPARLLAVAVGNCLSASLIFCLSKSRAEIGSVQTSVTGTFVRNERNRLRIGGLFVAIEIDVPETDSAKLERCLQMFEDYCVVTASVRQGIDMTVSVRDTHGRLLYGGPAADQT